MPTPPRTNWFTAWKLWAVGWWRSKNHLRRASSISPSLTSTKGRSFSSTGVRPSDGYSWVNDNDYTHWWDTLKNKKKRKHNFIIHFCISPGEESGGFSFTVTDGQHTTPLYQFVVTARPLTITMVTQEELVVFPGNTQISLRHLLNL